jgi:hypothetical protein
MESVSFNLWELGFGSVGILLMVLSFCLGALAIAKTRQEIRRILSER